MKKIFKLYSINFTIKNFLKNPNKGGNPPKDIKSIININLSKKFILFICINMFIEYVLYKTIKPLNINIYKIRNKKNNLIEIITLIIIQAMLFIDERARILFKLIVPGNIIIIKKIFIIKKINKPRYLNLIFLKMINGIIFCTEDRIIKI